MAHKWALDAVERLLRDIRENDAPFGGVTMLFSGTLYRNITHFTHHTSHCMLHTAHGTQHTEH
jgi:hypothetical protein